MRVRFGVWVGVFLWVLVRVWVRVHVRLLGFISGHENLCVLNPNDGGEVGPCLAPGLRERRGERPVFSWIWTVCRCVGVPTDLHSYRVFEARPRHYRRQKWIPTMTSYLGDV